MSRTGPQDARTAEAPLEVRRNRTLCAGLGALAALVALAYLQRAVSGGTLLDWLLSVLMTLIALVQLAGLADSRTPLLVADEQGVRVRLGREWLGLPWASVGQVVVEQRDGPVRDGRLVVVPRDLEAALGALLPSSRRAAAWQRRLHGAPLAIPLSIGTRCTAPTPATELRVLADGRTDVVSARAGVRVDLQAVTGRARRTAGRLLAGGDPGETASPVPPAAPARPARAVARAEVVRDSGPRLVSAPTAAAEPARSGSEVPLGAVVFDDVRPRGVAAPVIGPEIRAARERAGLSVDELSERTRIRPHVLEGIEVDDFGACGGDFYARGHLTTLARYLGLDRAALVEAYDADYAHAPITASRVFEAELATGMSGGMRATTGGPRWGMVAAAVMALLMVWGVARYFTESDTDLAAPVVSDSAGLAANKEPITSPLTSTSTVTVLALGGRSRAVVRDHSGKVLWQGLLHRGDRHQVAGVAPFTVHAAHGSVIRVQFGRHWLGPVGSDTGPAQRRIG